MNVIYLNEQLQYCEAFEDAHGKVVIPERNLICGFVDNGRLHALDDPENSILTPFEVFVQWNDMSLNMVKPSHFQQENRVIDFTGKTQDSTKGGTSGGVVFCETKEVFSCMKYQSFLDKMGIVYDKIHTVENTADVSLPMVEAMPVLYDKSRIEALIWEQIQITRSKPGYKDAVLKMTRDQLMEYNRFWTTTDVGQKYVFDLWKPDSNVALGSQVGVNPANFRVYEGITHDDFKLYGDYDNVTYNDHSIFGVSNITREMGEILNYMDKKGVQYFELEALIGEYIEAVINPERYDVKPDSKVYTISVRNSAGQKVNVGLSMYCWNEGASFNDRVFDSVQWNKGQENDAFSDPICEVQFKYLKQDGFWSSPASLQMSLDHSVSTLVNITVPDDAQTY